MKRYMSCPGRLSDARLRPDAERTACRDIWRGLDCDTECLVYSNRAAAEQAVKMSADCPRRLYLLVKTVSAPIAAPAARGGG